MFASGSPFENVEINGKIYKPGQGNNAYIFPGISLGCVLFKAKHIPDKLFLLAARVSSAFDSSLILFLADMANSLASSRIGFRKITLQVLSSLSSSEKHTRDICPNSNGG